MFNWYTKLNAWLSPSVMFNQYGYPVTDNYNVTPQATAAEIAAEIARLNPTYFTPTPSKTPYTPNAYTANQLSQFNQPVQANPFYNAYLNKMGGHAGKTSPSQQATQQAPQGAK